MNEKLRKAIANNNDLYRVIFEQYQIKSQNNGFIWYCLEETPPLYSNLVTASKDWQPDNIFQQINSNFHRQNWSEWSVKDSFAVLDLRQFGFTKLFEANWFYLEPDKFTFSRKNTNLRYEIIENTENLEKWKLAWDADLTLGNKIFRTGLLFNSDVFIIAGFQDKEIVSGCLVNKTEDALGISNFFAADRNSVYWSELIDFIYQSIGKKDVLGYERKDFVERLEKSGFEKIGDLIIWLKKKQSLDT